ISQSLRAIAIGVGFLGPIGIGLAAQATGRNGLVVFLVFIGILAAAIVVSMATIRTRTSSMLHVMAARGELGPLPREVEVELRESGAFFGTVVADDLLKWTHMLAMEDTPDYIYFFVTALLAYGVPSRAFATDADQRAFCAEAQRLFELG